MLRALVRVVAAGERARGRRLGEGPRRASTSSGDSRCWPASRRAGARCRRSPWLHDGSVTASDGGPESGVQRVRAESGVVTAASFSPSAQPASAMYVPPSAEAPGGPSAGVEPHGASARRLRWVPWAVAVASLFVSAILVGALVAARHAPVERSAGRAAARAGGGDRRDLRGPRRRRESWRLPPGSARRLPHGPGILVADGLVSRGAHDRQRGPSMRPPRRPVEGPRSTRPRRRAPCPPQRRRRRRLRRPTAIRPSTSRGRRRSSSRAAFDPDAEEARAHDEWNAVPTDSGAGRGRRRSRRSRAPSVALACSLGAERVPGRVEGGVPRGAWSRSGSARRGPADELRGRRSSRARRARAPRSSRPTAPASAKSSIASCRASASRPAIRAETICRTLPSSSTTSPWRCDSTTASRTIWIPAGTPFDSFMRGARRR